MARVTATLNVDAGKEDSYSKSLSTDFTDATVVKQEVSGNNGSMISLLSFNTAKGGNTMQGFKNLSITNIGETTAEVQILVKEWDVADPPTTSVLNNVLSTLLAPSEFIFLPTPRLISQQSSLGSMANVTTVSNIAPASSQVGDVVNESGTGILLGEALDATETAIDVDDGDLFRVGDYIAVDSEVMEVTGISSNTLTVIRGVAGTTKATHSDNAQIVFWFGNHYHNYADVLKDGSGIGDGSSKKVKTNKSGKFKSSNFFAKARASKATISGLVSGSTSLKFYSEGGYQELGMSGLTMASSSGLTLATTYGFNITVDGTAYASNPVQFTVDSSDKTFGATQNGVLFKIQKALDNANIDVTVSIVNGDIRFTSNTNHSATAISLATAGSGTSMFGVGNIPAIASIKGAVASFLPSDTITDKKTGITNPNRQQMLYDNGDGTMSGGNGAWSGTIDYATGAIDFTALPNAEFVYCASYESAHGGGFNTDNTNGFNILSAVKARSVSEKLNTVVEIRGYN